MGTAAAALAQIKEKNYAQKYQPTAKEIALIEVGFDSGIRNLDEWEVG